MERTALSKGRRPVKAAPAAKSTPRRRTDAEIASAKDQLPLAMALCGFVADGELLCPWGCDPAKTHKKVKLFTDKKYVKCHKCKNFESAPDLVSRVLKLSFPAAVDLLNKSHVDSSDLSPEQRERVTSAKERAAALGTNSFKAELSERTVNLYNAVLASRHVSLDKAIEYYGQWHISPAAVATVGFVVITDPAALSAELLERFGRATVIASGIARALEESEGDPNGPQLRWMFSANYPVVEPQIGPTGNCHSMQFRPSIAQKRKVTAHKAGTGKYVPPFMSLRGATPEHLIGINLEHLASIPPTRVDIVEGAKDVAADLTLGNEAFGMPGTKVLPPRKTVDVLRRSGHTLRVCMDGDQAGIESQDEIIAYFVANGFPPNRIYKYTMPIGKDITDILVDRHQTTHQG